MGLKWVCPCPSIVYGGLQSSLSARGALAGGEAEGIRGTLARGATMGKAGAEAASGRLVAANTGVPASGVDSTDLATEADGRGDTDADPDGTAALPVTVAGES